jgi:hypothetical protein
VNRTGKAADAPRDARLELVAKLYQKSIWPDVERIAGRERLRAPIVVDLDPTTFCDLACPECVSGRLLNKGRFSERRLRSLAAELVEVGVRAVILIGGGEPLAHRGTRLAIEVLATAGVELGLVTNGTQLHRYADLLEPSMSWIRVSVDAATTSTYQAFRPDRRGLSRFDQVIGNMRSIAPRMEGDLGYSFLLMDRRDESGQITASNYGEVEAAGRLAKEIGCKYFELKAMFDMDHFVVGKEGHIIDQLDDQVRALECLADETFSIVASSTLAALRAGHEAGQPKDYVRCNVAELRTLLTPSGAYVCPYHRGDPRALIGDPVSQSFQSLWSAADPQRLNPSVDCRFHCARHEQNLEIDAIGAGKPIGPLRDDFDFFI